MSNSFDNILHFADKIRSMTATAEAVKTVMERIAATPALSFCVEIQEQSLKDLETVFSPYCHSCCHFQAHPPRCQLTKRNISPNQFSCKKYSPKYNSRK